MKKVSFILFLLMFLTLFTQISLAQSTNLEDGYLTYSTENHPKANGLKITMKYPSNWEKEEGYLPHIVQKFSNISNDKSIMIYIAECDLENATTSEEDMKEFANQFDSSLLSKYLPANAKVTKKSTTAISGLPAALVEYNFSIEDSGYNFYCEYVTCVFFFNDNIVMIMGSVADLNSNKSVVRQRMRSLKPVYLKMINSINIHNEIGNHSDDSSIIGLLSFAILFWIIVIAVIIYKKTEKKKNAQYMNDIANDVNKLSEKKIGIRRIRYLISLIGVFATSFLGFYLLACEGNMTKFLFGTSLVIFAVLFLIISTMKRLNNIGYSPWYTLLLLLQPFSIVIIFICLVFRENYAVVKKHDLPTKNKVVMKSKDIKELTLTLFIEVSLSDKSENIKNLLDSGADVNMKVLRKINSFHMAVGNNKNPEIISMLIDAGADINRQDEKGFSPLQYALYNGQSYEIINMLIEAGADVNLKDKKGGPPLFKALSHYKDIEIIKILIENGANVNAKDKHGVTPLHMAANYNNNPDVIRTLLKSGAEVNVKDKYGDTPLHQAAGWNIEPDVIKILIDAGADVNARDKTGYTPLHTAAENNPNSDVIILLLNHGANPNAKDIMGRIPWDLIQKNEALKNTKAYRALKEAQYK